MPVPPQALSDALAYIFAGKAKGAGYGKQDCAGVYQADGIEAVKVYLKSTRARVDGVLADWEQERLDRESARCLAKALEKAARYRQRCGAKTRKGRPCKLMPEAGKRRCKFHGGMCLQGQRRQRGRQGLPRRKGNAGRGAVWQGEGRVAITRTACHLGGARAWFICPCSGHRCAILYPVQCRHCLGCTMRVNMKANWTGY